MLKPNSTMALRAVATQGQQDDFMGFPLLRAVASYLAIEELMPPARLRWSRVLGRPLMDRIDVSGDMIGPVFIEEVVGRDCLICCVVFNLDTLRTTRHNSVPAMDGVGDRDVYSSVMISDPDNLDAQFEVAWMERYGRGWPVIHPGVVHPALRHLCDRFCDFMDSWSERNRDWNNMVLYLGRMRAMEMSDARDAASDMSESGASGAESDASDMSE